MITSTDKVRLWSIDKNTVAAWKRDRITERRRLDNKMREGGWGAISGAIADQTNAQWTARSLTSLDGVLDRANPARGCRVQKGTLFAIAQCNCGQILCCASMNEIGWHDMLSHERATFGSLGSATCIAHEFMTISTTA